MNWLLDFMDLPKTTKTSDSGEAISSMTKQKVVADVSCMTVLQQLDLPVSVGVQTKYSKVECPRFEMKDFRGWLPKMEQFFKVNQSQEADKPKIVMMHLEGKALQWHQHYVKNRGGSIEEKREVCCWLKCRV
ncbi:uncharacterized protein LOC111278783 [Durio zibethinus]|uniref:Uncharacterized protein LOC111278783 n=1 Tax=Durio zibethinus TaxID=66656 RepID=A0A6P5WYH0_DURZI|nr:uncharacterized protein LOC111278783 [Durio zibethinus]